MANCQLSKFTWQTANCQKINMHDVCMCVHSVCEAHVCKCMHDMCMAVCMLLMHYLISIIYAVQSLKGPTITVASDSWPLPEVEVRITAPALLFTVVHFAPHISNFLCNVLKNLSASSPLKC